MVVLLAACGFSPFVAIPVAMLVASALGTHANSLLGVIVLATTFNVVLVGPIYWAAVRYKVASDEYHEARMRHLYPNSFED